MRISGVIMMILWLHLFGACGCLFAMSNETAWPDFSSIDAPTTYKLDKGNPKDKIEYFLQISVDSALVNIDKLIQAAASADDTVMLSEAYYLKGVALYMDAAFDTAAAFFSKSAQIIMCKQCPDRRASIYTKTSDNLFLTNQSEEATEYLGKAWNICEKKGDLDGRARILLTLTRQFERLGLSSQYLNYLRLLRMNYLSKIKSPQLRIQICQLNASHMARTGQLRNAWAFYLEAEKLLSEEKGVYYSLSLARTRSELYYYSGDKEQAVQELQSAGEKAIRNKYFLEASFIYNLAAHFLQQAEKPKDALIFQRKAMRLREMVGFRMPLCNVYINYAIALRKAAQPDSITFYLDKALSLASKAHYLPEQKRASEELAAYYRNTGDFKRALAWLRDANYFDNQITKKLSLDQKKMLASKILSRGTEEEIYSLQSKIRANFLLMVLLVFAGGLVVGAFILAMRNRKRGNDLQLLEVKHRILVANLSPNFIFNSLVAIKNIIREGRNEEAGQYLSSFARLIRVIMVSPQVDYHPLDKDLNVLENYFQLQQIWLKERFSYQMDVPDNILGNRYVIPPFFCHPVMEQIIYSAQPQVDTRIHAIVIFSMQEGSIRQEIRLKLKGSPQLINEIMKQPKLSKTLDLTRQRLDILNKNLQHGRKGSFALSSQPEEEGGTFILAFDFPV